MANITINPIPGSYASVVAINDRLQQIETALNDQLLWRLNGIGEPNAMQNDLDMNGYALLNTNLDFTGSTVTANSFVQNGVAVTDLGDQSYLGGAAAPPTTRLDGSALVEGDAYWNNGSDLQYTWDGAGWIFSVSSAATNAVNVAIADAGAYYTGVEVEAALQEIGAVNAASRLTTLETKAQYQKDSYSIASLASQAITVPAWASRGLIYINLSPVNPVAGDGMLLQPADGAGVPLAGTNESSTAEIAGGTTGTVVDPNGVPLFTASVGINTAGHIHITNINDFVWGYSWSLGTENGVVYTGGGRTNSIARPATFLFDIAYVTGPGTATFSGNIEAEWWSE